MKIFVSYKFTGVPIDNIHALIDPLMDVLKINHEPYCNLYDSKFYKDNKYGVKQIMDHAFSNLEDCDQQLVLLDHKELSQGMCLEMGYAYKMKMPIILVVRKDIKVSTLKAMSSHVIEYDNHDDMLEKLWTYFMHM